MKIRPFTFGKEVEFQGGETVPISACACFDTDGVAKQEVTTLALDTHLEEYQKSLTQPTWM